MNAPLSQEQRIVHFLNRTSFGPTRNDIQRATRIGIRAYLDEQLTPERIADNGADEKVAALKTMRLNSRELIELYPPPRLQRLQTQQANQPGGMAMESMEGPRVVILELQQAKLLRALYSNRQLFEVMVDFWSNHFNIYIAKGANRWLTTAYDRDTIRPLALGKFKDLLLATAKSPAMLFYLDNWMSADPDSRGAQLGGPNNRRRGLNENYARELMELHTLGVDGGYTQKDVQEVARCFTGWTIIQPQGQGVFRFEPRIHDNGEKTILGQRIPRGGGMDDGLRVIDILVKHPSTAKFIATKLARRLVADEPPPAIVNKAAEAFRQSDGDIPTVLRAIVDAPEFFAAELYHAKIKNPFEFVASALRVTGSETQVTHQLLRYLGRMGEPLFLAQAPTGYADIAASWISADMLLTRMNFVADLVANRLPGAKVPMATLNNRDELVGRIAPNSLSPATQAALAETEGHQAIALLLAAPEFQRR
jgi:uncharacterized protein (DUF1800 family)